jgi:hypothetical protein
VAGDATVTPATLTVTASSTSTPYGMVPQPSAGYSGFQNSDGPSSLSTLPTCSTTVTATTLVGTYLGANTCSGGSATNYALQYVAGQATVTPSGGPSLTIVNGYGQAGSADAGDRIIVTYNPVPNLTNLCNGSSSLYPTVADPSVVVTGTAPLFGDDTITVTDSSDCSGGLNFGTIDLGQSGYFYFGTTTFGGPSSTCTTGVTSGCSSLEWTNGNTLTITLGAPSGLFGPIQIFPSVAVYTPAAGLGISGTISSAYEENF